MKKKIIFKKFPLKTIQNSGQINIPSWIWQVEKLYKIPNDREVKITIVFEWIMILRGVQERRGKLGENRNSSPPPH